MICYLLLLFILFLFKKFTKVTAFAISSLGHMADRIAGGPLELPGFHFY